MLNFENRPMKKLPLIAIPFLLAACGDEVTEVTNIYQSGLEVVDSVKDLPKCGDDNEGNQAVVKGEASIRVCIDGDWVVMTSDAESGDFACKTEELKDGSGLKIVCNGDSIGVVLNGSDGKDGKAGKDGKDGDDGKDGEDGKDAVLPSDTLENDSERVAISLDSLVGYTQKGPFLKGSTVYLYELSDGRTLKQTNGNFTSNITRDDGRYKFLARDLVSQYAMVVVDGYYRNEVTGVSSKAPIRLKAITDMRKRNSVNVNILTHLEFDRVYHLVTKGDSTGKKLTVKQAKRQAQQEILKAFYIELDSTADAEDMDVFGASEADAALLAMSILLQGDRTESEMLGLLSEISTDMAEDGKWDGARADTVKAEIADQAFAQDLAKLRKNVIGWHLSKNDSVGDFEKHVVNFISKVYGIEPCSEPSTAKQTVQNAMSIFDGRSYQCFEWENQLTWVDRRYPNEYLNSEILNNGYENDSLLHYGLLMDWRNRRMYHTIFIGAYVKPYFYRRTWLAENMDLDYRVNGEIFGTFCYNDDCEQYGKYGRLYTWAAAMDSAALYSSDGAGCGFNKKCNTAPYPRGICPEGWHIPTNEEWDSLFIAMRGVAFDSYGDSSLVASVLKSQTGWVNPYNNKDANGNNVKGFSAIPAGYWGLYNGRNDYYSEGDGTDFWSSTDVMVASAGDAFITALGFGRQQSEKSGRSSLRCIQD